MGVRGRRLWVVVHRLLGWPIHDQPETAKENQQGNDGLGDDAVEAPDFKNISLNMAEV